MKRKLMAACIAAALCMTAFTACSETFGDTSPADEKSTSAVEYPTQHQISGTEESSEASENDCCKSEESQTGENDCCKNKESQSGENDCCKNEESQSGENDCCKNEESQSGKNDCCKNEISESSVIPDCCGDN